VRESNESGYPPDFTDFDFYRLEDGVAYVHLVGSCPRTGSTWTVDQILNANLRQFPEIHSARYFSSGDDVFDLYGSDCFAP
jgi:hypothetical protein